MLSGDDGGHCTTTCTTEKGPDVDVLRQMVQFMAQWLGESERVLDAS
jgi:hypothetical protein